jgi:TDG/mug DNA glycosylase family protein
VRKPTAEELLAARDKPIADVIAPGLRVLLVGINPGLYSGATGFHFARPGNRFWPTLHGSGFTPRLLQPDETDELRSLGIGITNLVNRTTATAAELTPTELRTGADRLRATIRRYLPRFVGILGVSVYRVAFDDPKAKIGRQAPLEGADVWLLPNPSGANANYQLPQLIELFATFRDAVERGGPS